ncbi:RNA exonuclease 4 [Carcharodon carcharias]|uniref:RNA exonuclease 4 n=1 Tax=Carcharodon carcharias TaxID=13397 RepID=UPI001B7EFF67|nr:RNA exonuclease 4 [Carcharodon carcharias]XP_041048841.1 RNA exonuclease 4 [Carcharodon carcharias]XP_041048842.1 RNA exonuclease 4 [Carcharodon carcharias]XP_041048843.1 RNA exonuclease 4 [Carcharodon carcharias]XP_041048844.1 RNA exonuclease 4 [Carcharodon carcharias]
MTSGQMAKVKPGPQVDSAVPAVSELGSQKKSKKKGFWAKEKSVTKKMETLLPPRAAVEYSTNWKALQQIMNQTAGAKKVPESKSKIQTKGKTATVEKMSHRGIKPEKGGESKSQPDSQTTGVLVKGKGLKPDKITNQGTQQTKKKRTRNSQGLLEGSGSTQRIKRTKAEPETENHKEPDIWFDDVDPDDIEAAMGPEAANIARRQVEMATGNPYPTVQSLEKILVKDGAFQGLTKAVAMDCEMVGVGSDKVDSILARVSIVNQFGKCIYDKYVKPTEKVTDYRTWVSGIRPADMKNGEDFKVVQREVADILEGRTLVGHAVHNDLKILLLDHPKKKIRDTQRYKPFKTAVKCGRPSLKHLCRQILKVKVQETEHSSVQDAQATMRLYTLVRQKWEAELKAKHKTKKQVAK